MRQDKTHQAQNEPAIDTYQCVLTEAMEA